MNFTPFFNSTARYLSGIRKTRFTIVVGSAFTATYQILLQCMVYHQTAILVACLVAFGVGVSFLLDPYHTDELVSKICPEEEEKTAQIEKKEAENS